MAFFDFGLMGGAELLRITDADYADSSISSLRNGRQQTRDVYKRQRLVWLQIAMRHVYVDKATRQQQRAFEVLPRRGILYDRNLHELAVSTLADSCLLYTSRCV